MIVRRIIADEMKNIIIILLLIIITSPAYSQADTDNSTPHKLTGQKVLVALGVASRPWGKPADEITFSDINYYDDSTSAGGHLEITYFFKEKFGAGFRMNNSGYDYQGLHLMGQYSGGGFGLALLTGGPSLARYGDVVQVNISEHSYGIFGTYHPVRYEHWGNPFDIYLRSGFNYVHCSEKYYLSAMKYDSANYHYYAKDIAGTQKAAGLSFFIDASVDIRLSKYFSIMLIDVTQNLAIINPHFEGLQVSNGDKNMTLRDHRMSLTGTSFAVGISMHF